MPPISTAVWRARAHGAERQLSATQRRPSATQRRRHQHGQARMAFRDGRQQALARAYTV
jgi:hypothetical protein